MILGYDAKRLFHNNTGLGNYSRDLVRITSSKMKDSSFLLYNPKLGNVKRFSLENNMIEKRPVSFLAKKFSALWRRKGILKQLKTDKVDIFHGLSGEIPSGINKTGIKTIVTVHDLIFLEHPELYKPIDRFIYNLKFKKACQKADLIVSISEHTKKDIIKHYNINPEKIKVVYQGCHPAVKQTIPDLDKHKLKEKLNLPDNFLLNVGTIERRKNQETIVKALSLLDDEKLVIVGRKTKYFETIKKIIDDNNLQERVFFLEGLTMNELATLYQMADIFIYPSLYEGFGIPIIESLFSGTPVITTYGGVFPEAGGPDSLYVNPHNPQEIVEKVNLLRKNPLLREEITKKGRKYASVFMDDYIANQWKDIYTNILNKL